MNSVVTRSSAETLALGESWGRAAKAGLVIGLSGDLGVGKTVLVKGIAAGLGISEKISSPTFALVNEYQSGRLPLFHLDLYRLETREQIVAAGLEDYLYQSRGITVAEWIDRWTGGDNKSGDKKIRFVKVEQVSENERRITYEDFGT